MATLIEIRNIPIRNYVEGESPSGIRNSTNLIFTLVNIPLVNSERVFLNGIRLMSGSDYNVSGNMLTFISAPYSTDIILVDYRY